MKKLLSIAAVAALVLTGCNKDLKVTPADKLTIEYGDKLDNNKLFDAKKSDKNIKVDKVQDFNAKKVGDQTLKVTFTDGDKTIQKDVKITVKDTKKPEIVLKKDKVTITAGDKIDLKDNVKAVKDPVDGNLKYSDKEIKTSGYYVDKGKLNTKKAGTYEVIVKAFDANGNKTEKKFKVIVKKKKRQKQLRKDRNLKQPRITMMLDNDQRHSLHLQVIKMQERTEDKEAALRIPKAPPVPMERRVPLLLR